MNMQAVNFVQSELSKSTKSKGSKSMTGDFSMLLGDILLNQNLALNLNQQMPAMLSENSLIQNIDLDNLTSEEINQLLSENSLCLSDLKMFLQDSIDGNVDLNENTNLNSIGINDHTSNNANVINKLLDLMQKIDDKAQIHTENKNSIQFLDIQDIVNKPEAKPDIKPEMKSEIKSENEMALFKETKITDFAVDTKNLTTKNNTEENIATTKSTDSIEQNNFSLNSKIEHQNQFVKENNQVVEIKNFEQVKAAFDKQLVEVKENTKSMIEVKLQPEELGKMSIKLELSNGVLHGKILVDNEQARLALESQMNQIKNQIKNQGINVDNIDVDLSNDFNQQFQQQSHQNFMNMKKQFNTQRYTAYNGVNAEEQEIEHIKNVVNNSSLNIFA